MGRLKYIGYRFCRWVIRIVARPQLAGIEIEPGHNYLYVLDSRSLSDLIIVDLVCQENDMPSPLDPIDAGDQLEQRRFFFLNRATGGWFRRNTMQTYSDRMVRILENADDDSTVQLLPVAVFWGRAPHKESSLVSEMFSENWAVTSRIKRLLNLFISRHHIVANYGAPIALSELARLDSTRIARRAARLLRVQLRNQHVATLGPDFSHQRTLVNQILASRVVQQAIESQDGDPVKLERAARKAALSIVSNMSFPTIRVLSRLLTWFWNKIYNGLEYNGLHRVRRVAETHTIIYLPSHRSHLDYLILSYLLYHHGLMIPHIAAGDNLNLPILGSLLRRGGAFFMRRQFRGDPIYSAVFSEYLYQVYRRGHCVEFFLEGGRSRTGRLLPAKLGLLKMTLEHHERGIPRPLALMPVYFGYEKLVEAGSYLDELRGSEKRGESFGDLARSLRLVKQNFGKVEVNFGKPILLSEWAPQRPEDDHSFQLGKELLRRINESASVNPINLVALVTLSMPRLAIDEALLIDQIDCYLQLLRDDSANHDFSVTPLDGADVVAYVEKLGMISREHQEFGDVLYHDAFNAVLMTWYRNNVAHTLALPSLIACLVCRRRRPLNKTALVRMADTVFPYIAEELNLFENRSAIDRWLQLMLTNGLLELHPSGGYCTPVASSPYHHRLQLMARIITPTLERLYIVIGLLAQPGKGTRTRDALKSDSRKVAHKMTRIHGINAPEFFDSRLFDLFVDKLISDNVVIDHGDCLTSTQIVRDVLKAAESVIDPEFRYAIQRED